MTPISLNLSGRIDSAIVALYRNVDAVSRRLDIPYVVIGASARDLVLHHAYGAPLQRATLDVDFGIQVSDWPAFHRMKAELLSIGFEATGVQHRVIWNDASPIPVDILPFGGIADQDAHIQWPPDWDVSLSVLGFGEAHQHAWAVLIDNQPRVEISVASPAGMALMKLIAWKDRIPDVRRKDAQDFHYLLVSYSRIPTVSNQVFETPSLMESYDWDIDLACAHLLGVDARVIAENQTFNAISSLVWDDAGLTVEQLERDMRDHPGMGSDPYRALIAAFFKGFLN